jgi:biotin carboxyl carrier protein
MTVQLRESDVLPPMREDLVVVGTPHPTTGDLISVQDPVSKRVVRFRGFELSLARLLDGKRTARQVLDAARGLGIPLTLPGLQNFTAKLNAIGFLAKSEAPEPTTRSTWKPRPLWSPEVREQFRAALRDAREDRLDQARGYLEQVLRADPKVTDAKELIGWIDARKQTIAGLVANAAAAVAPEADEPLTIIDNSLPARLPPVPPPPAQPPKSVDILGAPSEAQPMKSFGEVFADADQGWYSDAAAIEDSVRPRSSKSGSRRVVGVALVGATAAALLVPLPRTVTAGFTLAAEDDVAVTAPQAGTIAVLKVSEGKWVEVDDELLQLTDTDRANRLSELDKQIADLEEKAASAPKDKKKKKGEDPQRALRLAKIERNGLSQKKGAVPVNTVASGFVRGLAVKAGDVVAADAALCHVVASKQLVAKIEAPYGTTIANGQHATLKIGGRSVEVTLENASRNTAEATVENADGALPVGSRGEARIAIGARSFLSL